MKHVPLAIMLLGLACIGLSPLSCHGPQPGAPLRSELEAQTAIDKEAKHFFAALGIGIFLLCFGEYLRGQNKSKGYNDLATIVGLNCPRCGKFWLRRQCGRAKQFDFIPRRTCPECGQFAELSSAVLLGLGLALFFGPFLMIIYFGSVPKIIDALGGYLAFFGFIVFMLGLLIHHRQFKKIQKHSSPSEQSK